MNKTQLKNKLGASLEVEGLALEGVVLSGEWLLEVITSKVYRTAVVLKNVRESDKGGVKVIIGQALQAGLVTPEQGLNIIMSSDKAELSRLKELLPKSDKTEEPNEEDIEQAIKKVLAGGGQNDF